MTFATPATTCVPASQGLLQLVAQHLTAGMHGSGAVPPDQQYSASAASLATALIELPYKAAIGPGALDGAEALPALAPGTPLLPLLHAVAAAVSRTTALASADDQKGAAV